MRNKAIFYIRNGELRCRLETPDKIKTYREEAAIQLLREIDKNDLSIMVKDNKAVLYSDEDNTEIEINDNVFSGKYWFFARKTAKRYRQLNKSYKLQTTYNNSNIKKALVRGSLIAAGPIAAIIIGTSLNKPEKTAELNKEVVELEFNMDDAELYFERIQTDDTTYLSNDEETPTMEEMDFVNNSDSYIESVNDNSTKPQEIFQGTVELETAEHSQDEDVIALREKYMDDALKAQERWGIDARLLLAMLTQESHGRHTNLMQIQFSSFSDEIMRVYNFEEEREMKVVFTNNPQKYAGKVDMTISEEEMKDPAVQIKLAAMIMNYNNYNSSYTIINPTAMLYYYNQGPVGAKKILDATPGTRESILGDPSNTDMTQYAYVTGTGDPEYAQNVTQYLDQTYGPIRIYTFHIDESGEKYPVCVYYTVEKTLENTIRL